MLKTSFSSFNGTEKGNGCFIFLLLFCQKQCICLHLTYKYSEIQHNSIYKTSNLSMIQLPFLPSFPAVPASLCSYDLIWVLLSFSKQVVKLLLGAGQVFSCCQPCTDKLLSEMCGFGTNFGMARPLVQWPWVEGREQPNFSNSKVLSS